MVRVRKGLMKRLPVAAGLVAGIFVATLFASQTTAIGEALPQDPAVTMQIQQALNNFQVQMQSQLTMIQTKLNTLEREVRDMRFQLDTGASNRSTAPGTTPANPVPGTTTWGRVVSQSSESERFALKAATGQILGNMGMTSDGPALILYDASGQISAALVATPTGPELRMADTNGVLQTILPQ